MLGRPDLVGWLLACRGVSSGVLGVLFALERTT